MLICSVADGPVLIAALGSGEAVLKFECRCHMTLITAQPQPHIPLSLVIHLC